MSDHEASGTTVEWSEIVYRFNQCVMCRDWIDSDAFVTEADTEPALAYLRDMEEALIALPAITAQEMAAKVAVWTAYGSIGLNSDLDDTILAEVRALVGLPPEERVFATCARPLEVTGEIETLFREWKRLTELCAPDGLSSKEVDAWHEPFAEERWRIEDRMFEIVPTTARQLAMQVTAATTYGAVGLEPEFAQMIAGLAV